MDTSPTAEGGEGKPCRRAEIVAAAVRIADAEGVDAVSMRRLAELARAYAADGDGVVARRYGAAAYALTPMNPAAVVSYAAALEADGDAKGAGQLRAKLARL